MFNTGLTSITLRQLSVDEVINVAKQAKLDGIEWGSDLHVPEGDFALAADVRQRTEAAGLTVCSYGSYYRCDNEAGDFVPFLNTAIALGANVVRVWAGRKDSDVANSEYRNEVASALKAAVELATANDVTVALEYHGNTLTDTQASAHQLLEEVGAPQLKLYWQPRTGGEFENDLIELNAALPHLSHIHAFHWGKGGWKDRLPFADGKTSWLNFLTIAQEAKGDRFVIFEFTRNDAPENLLEDAKALHEILSEIQP